MQIIEGTWEEIKRHEAELTGRQVRLIIKSDRSAGQQPSTPAAEAVLTVKQLRGRGLFAGLLSTEEYLREKREETLREDRSLF